MTLLIGTASDNHVLLTADRRCTVEERGVISRLDTFQKIFPVPQRPIALLHHGENVFLDEMGRRVPLNVFLATLMQREADIFDGPSIETITARFAEEVEHTILRTLRNRGKDVIGFWIGGFAQGRTKPEIYERCWYKDGRLMLENCHNLVIGGDAQEHLLPAVRDYLDGTYNLDNIPRMSVEKARRYHQKLFAIAIGKEPEPRRFSETKDQLSITKENGCQWVVPPN